MTDHRKSLDPERIHKIERILRPVRPSRQAEAERKRVCPKPRSQSEIVRIPASDNRLAIGSHVVASSGQARVAHRLIDIRDRGARCQARSCDS
jgi:hypothetical protein